MKNILLILCAVIVAVFSLLFIATTFKTAVIPDQYCKKVYEIAKQCVPGCIWKFDEPEFKGFKIEKNSTPFLPQGMVSCVGR